MNFMVGALIMVAALVLLATGWLGCTGRLPHNHLLGIRTRRTLADPRTWRTVHQEAGPWIMAAGVADLLAGLALLSIPAGGAETAIAIVAAFLTVALITAGAAVGLNGPAGSQETHQDVR